jgi:hypothetical protein
VGGAADRDIGPPPPGIARRAGCPGAALSPRPTARACPHVRPVRFNREPLPLSARLGGGRGRGPAWLRREGEVGSSAVRDGGSPTSPHPDPLRPQGRRGGYSGRLSGCEIYACPSGRRGEKEIEVFETTAGQVTDVLKRLGVPTERIVTLMIEPVDWLTKARQGSRRLVIAAGLGDDDIDRLIKRARKEVEPRAG